MQKIQTYQNELGNPIVRKCANCQNWMALATDQTMGYCKIMPILYAYTLEKTHYAITRKHNNCEQHVFANEAVLKEKSNLIDYDKEFLSRSRK